MINWKDNLQNTADAIIQRNNALARVLRDITDLRFRYWMHPQRHSRDFWVEGIQIQAKLHAQYVLFNALATSPTLGRQAPPSQRIQINMKGMGDGCIQVEKIYLRNDFDDKGNTIIVDQHGRQVAGLTKVSVDSSTDHARVLRLELYARNAEGKPFTH